MYENTICVVYERFVLTVIQRRLFDFDWDIGTASLGVEASGLFDEEFFHIIVSGVRMFGMDGVELLKWARELHLLCDVHIGECLS